MPAQKKIPMSPCSACREEKPKKEVLRSVRTAAGERRLDLSGRRRGRGAYFCNTAACIARLRKQKLLHKTFSCEVPEAVYAGIEEEFSRAQ